MTRRSALRQADMTRALKAAKAAGCEVARIEIEPDGKIVILTGKAEAALSPLRRWEQEQEDRHARQA